MVNLELMPKPAEKRQDDNPWPEMQRTFKTEYAHEEAMAVYGHDVRQYCVMTKEFIGDQQGNLKGMLSVSFVFVCISRVLLWLFSPTYDCQTWFSMAPPSCVIFAAYIRRC